MAYFHIAMRGTSSGAAFLLQTDCLNISGNWHLENDDIAPVILWPNQSVDYTRYNYADLHAAQAS